MSGALLTLCTSILILLFIHSSLLCVMALQGSVRRWQLHGRWSPIFSLMDSKTKSYMFCNLGAREKKNSHCLLYRMCTDTALNYNAKFCSKGFLCKKAEQGVTPNIKKKKSNTTVHAHLLVDKILVCCHKHQSVKINQGLKTNIKLYPLSYKPPQQNCLVLININFLKNIK